MKKTLKELMEEKGLTPIRLAAAMEVAGAPVSVFGVANWLSGANVPRQVYLRPLAEVLGVSVGEVLEACNASVAERKALVA